MTKLSRNLGFVAFRSRRQGDKKQRILDHSKRTNKKSGSFLVTVRDESKLIGAGFLIIQETWECTQ